RLLPECSRNRLQIWIREKRVWQNGAPAIAKRRVWGGEKIRIAAVPAAETLAHLPEDIPLDIIHEDDSLLVVNKPPGLVVHPGSGNWRGTLLNALLKHSPGLAEIPRAGIVHRLDKDTSGLLVVAKTLEAQTNLVRQLQARSVKREYLALVQGKVVRGGQVEAPIGRHPFARTRMAVVARGKPALTYYEVMERFAHCTLLCCRLETGRTHQIRVHMQSIGHPLVGDPVYSAKKKAPAFARQALHAYHLALLHPRNGKTMGWKAGLPADMRQLLESLRGQN
ncbi:MAG TPA: RluA family pseudouridine synthase, partial [Burkholderiales bacterium]|nr:RluA family pseudouridine synthase [Burkholderiales bacterium]